MFAVFFAVVLGLVLLAHVWNYERPVNAYTFARPNGLSGLNAGVLREKTPVAVEVGSLGSGLGTGTGSELQVDFTPGLAELGDARPWWWLPGLWGAASGSLTGDGDCIGLSWVTAERQWIGCPLTSTSPLSIWLVHSKYRRYLSDVEGMNPWTLTDSDVPLLSRVQFVEVVVRPGWALGIPAHWGWAARAQQPSTTPWWRVDQHSAVSLVADGLWNEGS